MHKNDQTPNYGTERTVSLRRFPRLRRIIAKLARNFS